MVSSDTMGAGPSGTVMFGGRYSRRLQSKVPSQRCQNVLLVIFTRQGPPGGPVKPSLHTQPVASVLPATDQEFSGQLRQKLGTVTFTDLLARSSPSSRWIMPPGIVMLSIDLTYLEANIGKRKLLCALSL